jgi:flagellar motor component MotA
LVGEVLIVGGLLLVQCVLSGYVVFTDHLLALGADPLAVIVVAGAAYAAFCLPLAVALERSAALLCFPSFFALLCSVGSSFFH